MSVVRPACVALVLLVPACGGTGSSASAGATGSSGVSGSGSASTGSGTLASGSTVASGSGSGSGAVSGALATAGSGSGAAGSGVAPSTGASSSGATGAASGVGGAGSSTGAASGATGSGAATGASSGAPAGDYPAIANGGPCPTGAIYCDNFEEYPAVVNPPGGLDLTQMLPSWYQFSFHGFPRVDNALAYRGKQAAHYDTEAGSYRFAAFIRETPDGTPVAPLAHWGRVMVNLNKVSPTSQWTIIEAGGLLPGSTTEMATFGFGGNMGHLAASYTQRPRIVGNDGGIALRPGGPENDMENAKAALACTKTAMTETMPTAAWVCVEWNIDAASGTMHLWLNGTAQTEIDVVGHGTECSIGMPTAAWSAPAMFTKLDLTWEGYGTDSPGQQSYFDEFAVGTQRLGCPP